MRDVHLARWAGMSLSELRTLPMSDYAILREARAIEAELSRKEP